MKEDEDIILYCFDDLPVRSIGKVFAGDHAGCYVVKMCSYDEPILAEVTGKFYLKGQDLKDFGENIELLRKYQTVTIYLED